MADGAHSTEVATNAIENTASDMTADAINAVTSAVNGAEHGDFTPVLQLGSEYLIPVISAVAFVFIGYFFASFLSRISSAPVRNRVDETLGRFVAKLVFYSIMAFVLLGVLGQFGISVASFAAVLAAAGFAVGLAFQGTLSNFAAGILLLVFRPFKVGDVVHVAGVTGKINEIDLFTTTFTTPDNRRIIVPNSSIAGTTIENITFYPERRVDINVGVDYSADLHATREALAKAAESLRSQLVVGEGRGYQIFLSDLGDSAVNWKVRFWTKTSDYWAVWEALTGAIKESLDNVGIGIPYPQMDIHVDVPEESPLLRVAK